MAGLPDQPANDGDVAIPAYAELHALSDFSFQRGASSARELFERAKDLGYGALAVTDECSLSGIVRALEASLEMALPLIVGSEFRLSDGTVLVLLVENQAGYTELCRLITLARRRARKGSYELHRADLEVLGEGLCLLWAPGAWNASEAAAHDLRWNCTAASTTRPTCRPCVRSPPAMPCRAWPPATCTCTCAAVAPCRTR
jgi:error-prone DNA polymerase